MKQITTIITFCTLLLSSAVISAAQESYSLQQCIDYAVKNHATIKNAELDAERR